MPSAMAKTAMVTAVKAIVFAKAIVGTPVEGTVVLLEVIVLAEVVIDVLVGVDVLDVVHIDVDMLISCTLTWLLTQWASTLPCR